MRRRMGKVLALVALGLAVVAIWATDVSDVEFRWNWQPQAVAAQAATATTTTFTLMGGTVAEGVVGSFELRGDTFPTGLAGFGVIIEPVDPTVAQVVAFDSPDYGLELTDATGVNAGGLRYFAADLHAVVEPGAFGPLLTQVRIEGLSSGTTMFNVTVIDVGSRSTVDESGTIIASVGVGAIINVSASRDLDGDGLTEDINGNGSFEAADIVELWKLLLAAP